MLLLIITFIAFLLDQYTKFIWGTNTDILVIPGFFSITSTSNTGIAFSIPLQGILLIIVTIVVMLAGVWYVYRQVQWRKKLAQLICGLVLGGALGNLYDRIFHGSVTDFISVSVFPVFNLADSFIFIGVVLFILFHKRIELKK